jgi:hypothetical protein
LPAKLRRTCLSRIADSAKVDNPPHTGQRRSPGRREPVRQLTPLRNQCGTVYLSQSSFETHWRFYYLDSRLEGVRPFLGFAYYYYKQSETSGEIGNMARIQSFGPEFGVNFSFEL